MQNKTEMFSSCHARCSCLTHICVKIKIFTKRNILAKSRQFFLIFANILMKIFAKNVKIISFNMPKRQFSTITLRSLQRRMRPGNHGLDSDTVRSNTKFRQFRAGIIFLPISQCCQFKAHVSAQIQMGSRS